MHRSLDRQPGWRRLLLAAALAFAASCGYRFAPQGGALPCGARSLGVPVFRNASPEAGIEAWFSDAMRVELARRGLEGGAASDAEILGEVTAVSDGAAIYSSAGNMPISVRVHAAATVRVVCSDGRSQEVKVAGAEDYMPTAEDPASMLLDEANRRTALRRLADRLMSDAIERLQSP